MVKPSVKPQKLQNGSQNGSEVEQENDLNTSNVSKSSQGSKSGDKVIKAKVTSNTSNDVGSRAKTVKQNGVQNGGETEESQDFMSPVHSTLSKQMRMARTMSQKASLILPVLKVCIRLAA